MNQDLREQFPQLKRKIDGKPISYLDSAATALKPYSVLDADREYSTTYCANVHRGKHTLSDEASSAFERARQVVAGFLDVDPAGIIFTRNATESLNLVASGLRLSPQDVVVSSVNEHHSNLVPWMRAARVQLFRHSPTEPIDVPAFADFVGKHRPKVVALGHASNVTGVVHPIRQLCEVARKVGAVTVIDGAQSAPHLSIRPADLNCDFVAFSGHKMLGPAGIGALWGRSDLLAKLEPLNLGGGTVDRVTAEGFTLKGVPYRFEAGTPNVGGAIGMAAGIEFLTQVGMEELAAHEQKLAAVMQSAFSELPHLKLLQATQEPRLAVAVLLPTSERIQPDHLARVLSDAYQTMTRSGFFCAHPLFDELGAPQGGLRVSAYLYNTEEEIVACAHNLRRIVEKLGGVRG